jgi:hypothetical protein
MLCLGPTRAQANQPAYFDHGAALTAASTMAVAIGGGAIWYNPAGLDGGELQRIDLSGSVFVLRLRDFRDTALSSLPSGQHRPAPIDAQLVPVPSSFVFQRRLRPKLTLALAVLVTQADSYFIKGNLSRSERFPDDQTPIDIAGRGDVAHQSQTYRMGIALAGSIGPRLRLGLALFGVYGSLQETSLYSVSIDDQAYSSQPSSLYLLTQKQRRLAWFGAQLVGGLQWRALAGLHLGLTVRSPVLSFGRAGETLSAAALQTSGPRFDGPLYSLQERQRLPVSAGTLLEPAQVTLGVAWRGRRWLVGLEADLGFPLPGRWHGFGEEQAWLWNLRVGARFWLRRPVSLGVGVFTDRTAKRETLFIGDHHVDYYGATLGVEWHWLYRITVRGKSRDLRFVTALALRYAAGPGALRGVRYAPASATHDELSVLTVEERAVTFHALSLYLGTSLEF